MADLPWRLNDDRPHGWYRDAEGHDHFGPLPEHARNPNAQAEKMRAAWQRRSGPWAPVDPWREPFRPLKAKP